MHTRKRRVVRRARPRVVVAKPSGRISPAARNYRAPVRTLGGTVGTRRKVKRVYVTRRSVASPFNSRGGRIGDQTRRLKRDSDFSARDKLKRDEVLRGAERSTRSQAVALWQLVNDAYGGGPMPRTRVNSSSSGSASPAGFVSHSRPKTANITPMIAVMAAGVNPRSRASLQSTLLHEWAHTKQPYKRRKSARVPRSEIEGGAEAFSRDVARQFGFTDTNRSYPKEVRRFRARHSGRYLRSGQFK